MVEVKQPLAPLQKLIIMCPVRCRM